VEKINVKQDLIFLEREGNSWFDRNSAAINKKNTEFDFPTYLIDLIKDKSGIEKIAELGCSNGWRLQKIQRKFPHIKFSGIDASLAAIEDGHAQYPQLELHHGLLADIPLQEKYDIVIIYFVFHWVDRSSLAKSIAEVDRLVKDGGMLIIGDFSPDFPQRRRYHHLPEDDVFTYKQNYPAIFESFGTYKEVTKFTGNHDGEKDLTIQACNSSSRFACSVLHKSLTNYYQEL
jgi:SAM-dependent methyltransferase